MRIEIHRVDLSELDKLMKWRMKVLRCVFNLPENINQQSLYDANMEYYNRAVLSGEHIAVFAAIEEKTVGCGGVCFYREMPSPDNPSGLCAYLMNIYTEDAYRGNGVGKAIVEWLTDYAKSKNISKIYLETSDCGRRLYKNIGFEAMKNYMKMGGRNL